MEMEPDGRLLLQMPEVPLYCHIIAKLIIQPLTNKLM